MRLIKYHALGNDYLVLHNAADSAKLMPASIQKICHRHFGVGADGILIPRLGSSGEIAVRIFNPDGSEAEKSGNGLRIFARWLFDEGVIGHDPIEITTLGGPVRACVLETARAVQVDMGRVLFEALHEPLVLPSPFASITVHIASIGNPHCVVLRSAVSEGEARALGPLIENHPRFPRRTNVQMVRVLGRNRLQLEIWERGAGYTLASGSSSCVACAVAVRLGLCEPCLVAQMPGGELQVEIAPDFHSRITGPVVRIARIDMDDAWL